MNLLSYQPEMSRFLELHKTTTGCPRSILLYGPEGYGQSMFIEEFSKNIALPVVDMTDDISTDSIQQIALATTPYIYYINLNNLSNKDQSALLITLEKPFAGSFFVLEGRSDIVFDAVRNRCHVLNIDRLIWGDLKSLFPTAPDCLLESILSPAEIETYMSVDLTPYSSLIDNMISNFNRANISNILTISNRFAWDKNAEGLDIKLFCALLLNRVLHAIRNGAKILDLFYVVKKLTLDISSVKSNGKRIFENFLIMAKENKYQWC